MAKHDFVNYSVNKFISVVTEILHVSKVIRLPICAVNLVKYLRPCHDFKFNTDKAHCANVFVY